MRELVYSRFQTTFTPHKECVASDDMSISITLENFAKNQNNSPVASKTTSID
ncbi:hypothetical protein [Photobacterium jeanii]|uniref:hypothetical protein n=1 Tax=Photobacterium jeanii TaxID=858640 RepID=UPI0012F8F33B|nr:hypothetical protein [Photobacterium jeanii]